MHERVSVLVVAVASPLLIGVYRNDTLLQTYTSQKKTSDALAEIFTQILRNYRLEALYYANGPGSFLAIKVAYIFLKTLSLVYGIDLYSRDAFYFNDSAPIKAVGKLHFVKIRQTIQKRPIQNVQSVPFRLPTRLKKEDFSLRSAPFYGIDAV